VDERYEIVAVAEARDLGRHRNAILNLFRECFGKPMDTAAPPGARDDFHVEPIDVEEFCARFMARSEAMIGGVFTIEECNLIRRENVLRGGHGSRDHLVLRRA